MEQRYRVDLSTILDELGAQIALDENVELDPIIIGSETFIPVAPAHVTVTLINTGAGVVAQGAINIDLNSACSRCLREFILPAVGNVEGFYVSPAHSDQLPEEQDYELIADRSIDLMPTLVAALTIDLPFAPVHDPECKGICPTCGIDRNEGSCRCSSETANEPFAALRDLFPSDEDSG
jgi:uncharacterized protein